MTYEDKCDKARRFIADCEITDSRETFEASPVPMYLVDDVAKVREAYVSDLKNGVEIDEDVGEFLDRHGIGWE